MQPTPALIAKFFKRECTAGEAELVHRYLAENPLEMDKYLCEAEWQAFTLYKAPDASRSDQILQNILRQIQPGPAKRVFRLNTRFINAVAAVVCIFFTCVLWLHVNPRHPVKRAVVKVEQPAFYWKTTQNNGRSVLNITLDDGSRIVLNPKSSIRYTLPFKRPQRNIQLKGVARFFVAKDKHRPFTVYAGPLATTALGTVFKITAWPQSSRTQVRLLSGKVKVVQYRHPNPDAQVVYLIPGKELVFDNADKSLLVSAFSLKPAKPTPVVLPGYTTVKGDTLNFINQQLPLVMNKLQDTYHVRIASSVNLKKYYFTGDFNVKHESLANVLNTITILNKLHYTMQPDSTYTISKP
jgi:transmembrane sensor